MSESAEESTRTRYVAVEAERAGQRLDNFLLAELRGVPRSLIYRLLRTGQVRVNKGRVKAGYRIEAGDQVRIPPVRVAAGSDRGKPSQSLLDQLQTRILYEDKRLIVVNKPSGLAVHGGSGIGFGVIEALRALRPQESSLQLVHRLDRDTSGCLLVAKRRSMLRWLHELIRGNGLDKRYIVLLAGRMKQRTLQVDEPLRKNTLKSGERIVRVDPDGKRSRTVFRLRRQFTDATFAEAQLHTGRTHQIRVHAAYLDTPVLGDDKYGDRKANAAFRKKGLRRLFLHASALTFPLSENSGKFSISAPLDSDLEAVLTQLR